MRRLGMFRDRMIVRLVGWLVMLVGAGLLLWGLDWSGGPWRGLGVVLGVWLVSRDDTRAV